MTKASSATAIKNMKNGVYRITTAEPKVSYSGDTYVNSKSFNELFFTQNMEQVIRDFIKTVGIYQNQLIDLFECYREQQDNVENLS